MADARTIALVGASGRTSFHVLSALLALPSAPPVRAIVRGTSSADKLRAAHATLDVVAVGDYLASAGGALDRALAGARVVWYNAPAFTPYAGAGAVAVVDAAMRAGAQHFVFCGVLHPLLTKLINHKDKLPIEEYIIESGMPYTILQPTSFMENIPLPPLLAGTVLCPYAPSVLQGFLALADIAEMAGNVLTHPEEHAFARYELVGDNRSLADVAAAATMVLGKEVKTERVPREQAVQKFAEEKGITSFDGKDGFERMLYYYDKRGIPGNTNICRWLLGRAPTTWETYITRGAETEKQTK